VEKVERDGKTAVLYSPGRGLGWSTLADDSATKEALCMDARIVGAFLAGGWEAAEAAVEVLFPRVCTGGASDLEVAWIEKGKSFEIEEHAGSERLHVIGERPYLMA
jgi:hypothetical protein